MRSIISSFLSSVSIAMQCFWIFSLVVSTSVAVHAGCSNRVDDDVSASSDFLTLFDYQKYADSFWDRQTRGYYESGAMLEQTLRDNREAFKRIRFLPRFMRDVSHRDLRTTVLGSSVSFPVGVSPSAFQRLAHNVGENGTAIAAAGAGTVMILSTLSTIPLEQVAKSAPGGVRWLQLYVFKDRNLTRDLVKRAEKAGYSAIVVTVDAPVLGTRLADYRNRFSLPPHLTAANLEGTAKAQVDDNDSGSALNKFFADNIDASLTWKDISWLKSLTRLPVVVKGILTPDDALLAIQSNASAIFVSNHGGRQLDGSPATIDALPAIVQAVKRRVEIYLDGGIRTGMDVVKALAMGARMVFIGRPNLYGLSNGGATGSRAVLEILRNDLNSTMALIGAPSIRDIIPAMVYRDSS